MTREARGTNQSPTRISAIIPVFRDALRAVNAAKRLLSQRMPPGTALEIIIVDDGSNDGTSDELRRSLPSAIKVLELSKNRGRSGARQAGVDAATGEVVLFIDCDCEPVGDEFIAKHLKGLTPEHVASTGPVVGFDGSFWDRYQRKASERRRAMFETGSQYAGSTQNMVVRTDELRAIGGFDARYRHYGFEDRDLLARLSKVGRIEWCDDATIRHLDRIDMVSVSQKMRIAARESSRLFASQHPIAYSALGYGSIDVNERPWLLWPARALKGMPQILAHAFDSLERRSLLPWSVGFIGARAISAMSFLVGTAERTSKTARTKVRSGTSDDDLETPH